MSRIVTIDFTVSFIDALTAHIDREYIAKGKSLERLAIVFGGKRPAHFLKRALARSLGKSFVPPHCFTMDGFMDHVANHRERLEEGSDLDRSFMLYRLAATHAPALLQGRHAFAQFLPWAREILDFMEQLDLEAVDNKALVSIQENARIGYSVPESINSLLSHINALRTAFHDEVRKAGQTFRGLQYLRAAHEVKYFPADAFDEILFCNLFYFHRTEEDVVRHFYDTGRALLFFQGDERKWPVLKRMAARFGHPIVEGESPTPTGFELHLHAGTDAHSEAALVRNILEKIPDLDNTVVVLPDAGNVVPLLSELPVTFEGLNVSMGYPLKRSSLSFLLEFLMKAQLSRKDGRYYTKDYLKLLRHPFIKNLKVLGDGTALRVLVHRIEEALSGVRVSPVSGSSFITPEEIIDADGIFRDAASALAATPYALSAGELKQALTEVHRVFLKDWEQISDLASLAEVLGKTIDVLAAKSFLKNFPLNINIAAQLLKLKKEFEQAAFSREPFSFEEIFRIVQDRMSREMVHFSGTPLRGLQVLGLAETRSLNFDHVIIMDANEGVLPKLDIRASLVPREVMISLKLDRLELEEEIQRYQFMRIISSARHVHLVYQQRPDKERSRFIEELVWEAEKKAGQPVGIPVEERGFAVRIEPKTRMALKTPAMLEFLRTFRFSASSVNAYLRNPYEFYTSYVLGLREAEDLLDGPDGRMIGTFVHEVLKETFLPLVGKPFAVDEALEKALMRACQARFDATFARAMRSDAFLLKAVMDHRFKVFMAKERDRAHSVNSIISVEEPMEFLIPLSQGAIRFYGVLDRVEEMKDGTVLLLDYKTGASDKLPKKDFGMNGAVDLSREALARDLRSFQIPLYYYGMVQKFPSARIRAELYHLRNSTREAFPYAPVLDHEEFLKPYLKALDALMSEIMDPSVPFIDEACG